MQHFEHEIVVDDMIIKLYKFGENPDTFMVVSGSDEFIEIFGFESFQLERDNQEMVNGIIGQVVHYDQARALQILTEIKKAM